MRIPVRLLAVFALVVAFGAASPGPRAAGSSEYLFNMSHVTNDHELFLNLAVGDSGLPRPAIEPLLPRLQSMEADLPVVLFLSKHSGRRVDTIVDLRARGLGWVTICNRVNVSPDLLFLGIDQDPGPPFGRAWRSWKRNRRAVYLSDSDIAGLVQVQIGHRIAGPAPFELARGCGHGKPVTAYVAERRGRHHKAAHGHGQGGGKRAHSRERHKGKRK